MPIRKGRQFYLILQDIRVQYDFAPLHWYPIMIWRFLGLLRASSCIATVLAYCEAHIRRLNVILRLVGRFAMDVLVCRNSFFDALGHPLLLLLLLSCSSCCSCSFHNDFLGYSDGSSFPACCSGSLSAYF